MLFPEYFFVFDVESIGLHGEGFAVGGVVIDRTGKVWWAFCPNCPPEAARGTQKNREWVKANVPDIANQVQQKTPQEVRSVFWKTWREAQVHFPGIMMFADCQWPVEGRFVAQCISDDPDEREWQGPYPMHEIASIMLSAGMDPALVYDRLPNELPKHDPLADARQSARLLLRAIDILQSREPNDAPQCEPVR